MFFEVQKHLQRLNTENTIRSAILTVWYWRVKVIPPPERKCKHLRVVLSIKARIPQMARLSSLQFHTTLSDVHIFH